MKGKIILIAILIVITFGSVFLYFKINENDEIKPGDNSVINSFDDKEFDLKLLKIANSVNRDNYLISPYSIEVALSMVRDGANGKTKEEIESIIGKNKKQLLANNYVHIANALFLKDTYKDYINSSYLNDLALDYDSEILLDQFSSPAVINNWVKDKTDGMIDKVLDRVDPNFVLGIANAIAIDVEWQAPFECISTSEAEFTKMDNSVMNVSMMHNDYRHSDYKYIKTDNEEGIILPYEETTGLEFIAIMPKGNIGTYINNLTSLADIDKNAKEASSDTHISLSMPSFSYSYDFEAFKRALESMGMKQAFSPSEADFTNIISKENMNEANIDNLYIGDAIHKTYIDLNEKGTKAAAVTFFGFKATAAEESPDIVEINLNKSFLYMIRDTKTKTVLFVGVVNSPNEWRGSTCQQS